MHERFVAVTALSAALLAPLASPAATGEPRNIEATYDFSFAGIRVGEVKEHFVRDGERYRIESVAKPSNLAALLFPTFTETSAGSVTARGLRPDTFEHRRSDDDARTQLAAFDWQAHVVSLKFDGRSERSPIAESTQDALSMKYQFQFAPPAQGDSSVSMTDGKKVTTYRYRFVTEEVIETPAGRFATVHYSKVAEAGDSRFDLWLAKDNHYLPVRIVGEEKGRKAVQTLTRYTID